VTGRSESAGFTVLEALLSIALMSVIVVAALLFFATNTTAYRLGQVRSETHQNARIGLDEMEREIRVAGYDLSGVIDGLTRPTGIQAAQADELSVVAELDGDGVLDRVTYRLQGGRILRDFASWDGTAFGATTTGVVAHGVTTLAFQYFDETEAELPSPLSAAELDDVTRLTIGVLATDSATYSTSSYPLTVDVRLRNAN